MIEMVENVPNELFAKSIENNARRKKSPLSQDDIGLPKKQDVLYRSILSRLK